MATISNFFCVHLGLPHLVKLAIDMSQSHEHFIVDRCMCLFIVYIQCNWMAIPIHILIVIRAVYKQLQGFCIKTTVSSLEIAGSVCSERKVSLYYVTIPTLVCSHFVCTHSNLFLLLLNTVNRYSFPSHTCQYRKILWKKSIDLQHSQLSVLHDQEA